LGKSYAASLVEKNIRRNLQREKGLEEKVLHRAITTRYSDPVGDGAHLLLAVSFYP
jgi:hypothetical protein